MNKAELESKHLAELHALAAEAGVAALPDAAPRGADREARRRRRRWRRRPSAARSLRSAASPATRERRRAGGGRGGGRERAPPRAPAASAERRRRAASEPPASRRAASRAEPRRRPRRRADAGARRNAAAAAASAAAAQGRARPGPAAAAGPAARRSSTPRRRAGCTALLRELAAELSGGQGPRPGRPAGRPQPRGAGRLEARGAEGRDRLRRPGAPRRGRARPGRAPRRGGEDVILLIDSLSRLAEAFGGPRTAKEIFDAGLRPARRQRLADVVAALERPQLKRGASAGRRCGARTALWRARSAPSCGPAGRSRRSGCARRRRRRARPP